MTRRTPLFALTALATAALFTGCSETKEKATEQLVEEVIEQNGGGSVDIEVGDDGEVVDIETEDGSMSIGGGSLPDGWPQDVPTYDDGTIISSQSFDSNGELTMIVTYETEQAGADAAAAMQAAIEAAGFTIESNSAMSDGSSGGVWTVSGRRGDQVMAMGVTAGEDATTMVQLSLVIKPTT